MFLGIKFGIPRLSILTMDSMLVKIGLGTVALYAPFDAALFGIGARYMRSTSRNKNEAQNITDVDVAIAKWKEEHHLTDRNIDIINRSRNELAVRVFAH